MDPISQTGLTIVMMTGAYFWGKKNGVVKGSETVWHIIINSFKATHIDWDSDTDHLTFVNEYGRLFKSSDAIFYKVSDDGKK